ncbi:response regulator [Salinisphaera aquimarina]|uniref:Response regulator n=1 Tax=Salinisphaera aquimarina TaxID=2094031 RepID=A0ABV7ESF6_9GAMM
MRGYSTDSEHRATPSVVIVEDDGEQRYAAELLMRSAGYSPLCYASAEAMLDAPLPPEPLCFLVDIHLPGCSGLELQKILCRRIRHTAIVMLSGDASAEETRMAKAEGVLAMLRKPVCPDLLLDYVARGVAGSPVRDE